MFVLNLIRWFVGYVVFTVEGNGQERFVNLCARFGYTIWNVRRKEYFFVSISRTKYRMLKNLAKQTGVKIRIYKRYAGWIGGFHCSVKFFVYPCVEHTGRRKSRIEFRFNSAHR